MRFLHLSDLHIGKSVNGFSMIEEQKHALGQIAGYVKTERPAAVVIAGDVYDRAVPGVEAVRVFDDFLTRLAGENVAVLLISGNHDSPERLGYASRLLADKRLILCGAFDGAPRRFEMADEYGGVVFWLLPFIKPLSVRGMFGDREIESYDDAVAAAIGAAGVGAAGVGMAGVSAAGVGAAGVGGDSGGGVGAAGVGAAGVDPSPLDVSMAALDPSARNILISHQFYSKAGVAPLRSESELSPVGGLDAVDAGLIELFDYAALGHLHGCQDVGAGRIRYCGSPVKYSFSEWRHEKSVTLVELREKGDLSITPLPLSPIHDMREIEGELEKLMDASVSSLADPEDYLRVVLTDEEELIDPMGKLRSVYPNVMSLGFKNSRTNIDLGGIAADAETVANLSPYDLFREFFLEMQGSTISAEQDAIIRELLDAGES